MLWKICELTVSLVGITCNIQKKNANMLCRHMFLWKKSNLSNEAQKLYPLSGLIYDNRAYSSAKTVGYQHFRLNT